MLMSFRAEDNFANETDKAAQLLGYSRSEYLRLAVEAQNQRVLEERMQFLSKTLSESHLEESAIYDDANGDGLDEG